MNNNCGHNCSLCNKTGFPVQIKHLLLNTFLYKSHKVSQSSSIRRKHNRSVSGNDAVLKETFSDKQIIMTVLLR